MAKAKYTRGKDGFFRTKIWDGTYNVDGSKHRVILSSKKSSADLEKKVNELKIKVKNGDVVQQTEKMFITYAREWKTTYKDVREGNTARMYDNIIEKHLIALDKVKLCDIRRMHFQLVINNASYKPCTCSQIALTFRQIIKTAVREKMLPAGAYNDICEGIDLPRYKAKEKRALYPEEVEAMKAANLTPMERCFVYIIYGCGMRRGEVLALNKDFHIDLKKGVIKVNSSQPSMATSATIKAAIIQANTIYHTIGCFNQAINAMKAAGHRIRDSTITTADVGSLPRPGHALITCVTADTIKAITPMAINRYDKYSIISFIFIVSSLSAGCPRPYTFYLCASWFMCFSILSMAAVTGPLQPCSFRPFRQARTP